ncbi:MAG: YetF domain-containing protein [Luteimonas sp.]
MGELLGLSAPWWVFVLRAVAIYVVVMVLVRISGKRAVGQFTPFDLVLLILLGNAVQNGMNGGDNSLTVAAILSACLIGLNYLVAWASARWAPVRRIIEGKEVELARDGHIFRDVLRRELVSRADFDKAMRDSGCGELDHVHKAMLETNGHITIITRKENEEG